MDAADRVEIRAVTCPPNTLQAAALETDLTFNPGEVIRIEIVIPPGHAGATGLAIAQAHNVCIPASGSVWIISDDETIIWPVEDFLNNGAWSAFTYNLDQLNPHTWYLRFLVRENQPQAATQAPATPDVTAEDITAAGDQALAAALTE